jgi:hypothetical protein
MSRFKHPNGIREIDGKRYHNVGNFSYHSGAMDYAKKLRLKGINCRVINNPRYYSVYAQYDR